LRFALFFIPFYGFNKKNEWSVAERHSEDRDLAINFPENLTLA